MRQWYTQLLPEQLESVSHPQMGLSHGALQDINVILLPVEVELGNPQGSFRVNKPKISFERFNKAKKMETRVIC